MRSGCRNTLFVSAGCFAGLWVTCLAAPLIAFDLPVPEDESETRRMLNEGTLDSMTWAEIEPLYDNPVCVPCGELDALAPLVPERSADLPVSADLLDRYAPWDVPSIEHFFDDYPWLRRYLPVMTFSRGGATWGTVSTRYYRSGPDNDARKQAGFNLSPVRPLRFIGRFGITSEAALVERRSAGVDLGLLGTLALGNSGPPADDGLILGRFHAYPTDSANALDQWRYGELRSWNGAVWRLSKGGRNAASVTAFGHDRPTERAAGLYSEFHPWHSVSVRVGGSYLSTADSASDHRPFFAAHFGIGAALELWKINASTCLTVHDGVFSPVILSLEHRSNQTRIEAVVTWLPAGLAAPRSSVVGTLLNRIGLNTDTTAVPASLVCIDWSIDRRIGEMFRIHPFVSYLLLANGAGADCRAGATADIHGPLDATVSYRYRPGGFSVAVPSDRHETGLVLKYHFSPRFESSLTARYYARSDGYQRIRTEIAPAWLPDKALKISPCLSLYTGSQRNADFRWGCRSDLSLFPKVECNVRFEVPFNIHDFGETIIDVRSSFYF